ncbi:MAG: hypothetical protein K6F09_02915 [Clostridiales bacterium]|nr:hypothetical protein [Clostridiales bacterium]
MQNGDSEWETFLRTGKIADYLAYKRRISTEATRIYDASERLKFPSEEKDEAEHGRHSDKGKRDR